MKRYALFAGSTYYPVGGWDDFVETFDSPEEAEDHVRSENRRARRRSELRRFEWHHVIDLQTGARC